MRRISRALSWCAIALFAVAVPAAAQEPPLSEARVEGEFGTLDYDTWGNHFRFTPTCPAGACDLTGEVQVPYSILVVEDLLGDESTRPWVKTDVTFDGQEYVATAAYDNSCVTRPGGGRGNDTLMPVTWTATFRVTAAADIDGTWRATAIAGEQTYEGTRVEYVPEGDGGTDFCEYGPKTIPLDVALNHPAVDAASAGLGAEGSGAGAPSAAPLADDGAAAGAGSDDVDTISLADTAGDVGNRAALAAILMGAAAAMFSRLRGRRLRVAGILAGVVAIGGGGVELVAGGLLGDVDVNRHLASGAFSSVTGAAMAGGFAFVLPWLSRPGRDERRAGPLIPVLLAVWVLALRAMDGADLRRAGVAAAIALVIGLIAVMGASRTRARIFSLVGGFAVMVLTYLGAVVGDGSGTDTRTEAIIALALGGAAVLVAVLIPKNESAATDSDPDAGPVTKGEAPGV